MFQNVLGGLESVLCTNGILAWIFLENHEVHFRVPVGSIEGPGRILDHIRMTSRPPRVPWYGLCSLKGKNMAHTANFLQRAIWPAPLSLRILRFPSGKGLVNIPNLSLLVSLEVA